jgi:hypothetical protein
MRRSLKKRRIYRHFVFSFSDQAACLAGMNHLYIKQALIGEGCIDLSPSG